jgi:hypothetical protein
MSQLHCQVVEKEHSKKVFGAPAAPVSHSTSGYSGTTCSMTSGAAPAYGGMPGGAAPMTGYGYRGLRTVEDAHK